jgi:hypothetical protein
MATATDKEKANTQRLQDSMRSLVDAQSEGAAIAVDLKTQRSKIEHIGDGVRKCVMSTVC